MANLDIEIKDLGGSFSNVNFTKRFVWTSATNGYLFFALSTGFYYKKTTDAGQTWGSDVQIGVTTSRAFPVAVWFDKWTDGTGSTVHMVFHDTTDQAFTYRSLDTSTDTLGSKVEILSSSLGTGTATPWSIVKARGGNLYANFFETVSSVHYFYRSTDSGATWTARTTQIESSTDRATLTPGAETDNQDILCIYQDSSAGEKSIKTYDNSADSWSETAIADCDTSFGGLHSVTHRISDNHTIFPIFNTLGDPTTDLEVYDYSTGGSFTKLTNAFTAATDPNSTALNILVDQTNDDLFLFYGSGPNSVSQEIYYKKSTDDGTTWGSETQINSTETGMTCYCVDGGSSTDFEFSTVKAVYYNEEGNEWWINGVSADVSAIKDPILCNGIIPFPR